MTRVSDLIPGQQITVAGRQDVGQPAESTAEQRLTNLRTASGRIVHTPDVVEDHKCTPPHGPNRPCYPSLLEGCDYRSDWPTGTGLALRLPQKLGQSKRRLVARAPLRPLDPRTPTETNRPTRHRLAPRRAT